MINLGPAPGRATSANIGYLSGSSYSRQDLVTPEPIPLGVGAVDLDTALVFCDQLCQGVTFSSGWDVGWEATEPGGKDPGYFLDEQGGDPSINGAGSSSIDGFIHVLYLPPDDLVVNEERSILITATLTEFPANAGGALDSESVVTLTATIKRKDNDPTFAGVKRYDVDVVLDDIVDPTYPLPPCGSPGSQVCEFNGLRVTQTPAPTGQITRAPLSMTVGETRPFACDASDLDTLELECGTPPGYVPVVSNFDCDLISDSMNFVWTVTSGPGAGSFTRQGRTALFLATSEGAATIQVDGTTSDGETFTTSLIVMIQKPQLKAVEYGGNLDVARDLEADVYNGWDWYDFDDDGVANTEDLARGNGTTITGDRRFPVAYSVADPSGPRNMEVTKVGINCGVAPMAGSVIRGMLPPNLSTLPQFMGGGTQDPMETDWVVAKDMTSRGTLPMVIQGSRTSLEITWEVSFGNDNWIPVGKSDPKVYTTWKDPESLYFQPFETLFDIACRVPTIPSNEAAVAAGVWAAFLGRSTARKATDGHLPTDGVVMNYWRDNSPTNCQREDTMIIDQEGDGSCSAWAELLTDCLRLHGTSANLVQLDPPSSIYGQNITHDFLFVNNVIENTTQLKNDDLWLYPTDVTDVGATGIAAQDNPCPPQIFNLHYITLGGSTFYDPSYGGSTYADIQSYESAAFWGYFVDQTPFLSKDDPSMADVRVTILP